MFAGGPVRHHLWTLIHGWCTHAFRGGQKQGTVVYNFSTSRCSISLTIIWLLKHTSHIKDHFKLRPSAGPWDCEGLRKSSKGNYHGNWNRIFCAHGPSSVVQRHMWLAFNRMLFYFTVHSCGPFYKLSYNKTSVVRFWSVVVSWFCVRPISLRRAWHKIW